MWASDSPYHPETVKKETETKQKRIGEVEKDVVKHFEDSVAYLLMPTQCNVHGETQP